MSVRSPMLHQAAGAGPAPQRVLVWDVAVRTFHWALVATVGAAWLTGGSGERFHELAGSAVAALLVFRLLWGVAGTEHARFADFVRGPGAVARYAGQMLSGRARSHVGHNPAGGAMIVALLATLAGTVATGAMMLTAAFHGIAWVEEAHHLCANALLVLIPLHVVGAVVSSVMHRENLIGAMITGIKTSALPRRGSDGPAADRDEMLVRIRGSQGFSLLLFLLGTGIAAGWLATSGRTVIEAPAATAPGPVATPAAAAPPVSDPARIAPAGTGPGAGASPPPAALARDQQRTSPTQQSPPELVRSVDGTAMRVAALQREVRWRGRLTGRWSIDGVPFRVDAATRIDKSPLVGDTVEVRGWLGEDGSLRAARVRRR